MNTTKLEAALADMIEQKRDIAASFDDVINALSALLSKLKTSESSTQPKRSRTEGESSSYIEQAAEYIRTTGRPAHIERIVSYIRTARNSDQVKRGAVEGALLRHIHAKKDGALLIHLGKGMYGLPHHSQKPLGLSTMASPLN